MLKLFIVVAGLSALTLSTMPASAQDAAANQCRAAGHVKVFDGRTGDMLRQAPAGADSTRTAREHGSRAAVGRRMQSDTAAYDAKFAGGVRVAGGDVNGDGATDGRMQCSNNLKQLGTASH